MKPKERRRTIADRLDRDGACDYDQLAGLLRVSTMTIRRDVDALVRAGGAIKTLGGAQRATAPHHLYETDLRSRLMVRKAEKCAIAQAALKLVTGRQTIFIDGSTTSLELVKLLAAERKGLTVITNSALACIELGKGKENMTVGIGGQYDAASASFVGPSAEENAAKYFVDFAFVSTKGLLVDQGTFESAIATFHIKQIVARQAAAVVLLVDHSKFGQRALSRVLEIAQIHTIITDAKAPQADVEQLRRAGRRVLIADDDLASCPETDATVRVAADSTASVPAESEGKRAL